MIRSEFWTRVDAALLQTVKRPAAVGGGHANWMPRVQSSSIESSLGNWGRRPREGSHTLCCHIEVAGIRIPLGLKSDAPTYYSVYSSLSPIFNLEKHAVRAKSMGIILKVCLHQYFPKSLNV